MPAAGGRGRRITLLAVLFSTAFASLIYELVWTRELSHVFGTSALAVSTVLAVFMGGLALGSLYGGRLLARARNPYRFLAWLEASIGGSCLVALLVFNSVHLHHRNLQELVGDASPFLFNLVLFVVTSCVLILPTFLIGVAFPVIVELYHYERRRVGQSVGSCYMVDTIGGALGILLGAFYLVSTVGFLRTSLLASAINLTLFVLVLVVFPRERGGAESPATTTGNPGPTGSLPGKVILFLFFLSGLAALLFEVIWIRHVSLIYGGSLHSFAIVVVAFLLGLGIGSWLHNRLLANVVNKVRLFALIELGIGLTGLVATVVFPWLEIVFLQIYHRVDDYYLLMFLLAAICIGVLLVPTSLMGMTLPVLSSIYASTDTIGKDVGKLFSINSFGALAGSFSAGFLVVPLLGVTHSAFVASGVYAFIAVAFLVAFEPSRRMRLATLLAGVAATLVAVGVFAAAYRPNHVYNGAFYLGTVYEGDVAWFLGRQEAAARQMRFLKHSQYGQVAVYGGGGHANPIVLTNNGKIEASSDPAGVATLTLLGHIPILLHDRPQDVLTIGLGGGWTVSAVASHPVRNADVVELDPVVVEANRKSLYSYNGDPLARANVNVIINDGRNYVLNATRRYDIIISEPPEIWVSGVSSLFTEEFYRTARKILREGGLFCQWFPRYDLTDDDYRIALNTLGRVFPYLYEFDMLGATELSTFRELVIVASMQPIDVPATLERRRTELLARGDDYGEFAVPLLDVIEPLYVRGNEEIRREIGAVELVNTDDRPLLEFRTLRNRFRKFQVAR